jgi:hypothetical protein
MRKKRRRTTFIMCDMRLGMAQKMTARFIRTRQSQGVCSRASCDKENVDVTLKNLRKLCAN